MFEVNFNKSSTRTTTALLAVLATVSAVSAQTIYVNASCGNDDWTGTLPVCQHPDGPKATIQAGINAAQPADTVLVADGTYTGPGNRDMDFGGKAIVVRSENGAAACIIDIAANETDPHRAFYFQSGETSESAVVGFTIQNGFRSWGGAALLEARSGPLFQACVFRHNTAEIGGAVFNLHGNPTFNDCRFVENYAERWGGGAVHNFDGYATFNDCQFVQNHATVIDSGSGGGAILDQSGCESGPCAGVILSACQFSRNTATGTESSHGGAVLLSGVANVAELTGCTFEGNQADSGGAIGVIRGANATILDCAFLNNVAEINGGAVNWMTRRGAGVVGCVFRENHAAGFGGGLFLERGGRSSNSTVVNSTFWGNTASLGGGIYYSFGNDHTLSNSILWGNSPDGIAFLDFVPTVTYSDVQGGWPGEGNIDADPLFVDPAGGDYRVFAGSPVIDAGDNAAIPAGVMADLDGRMRIWDGDGDNIARVDMGCYEYASFVFGDVNCDGAIDAFDIEPFLLALFDPAGYAAQYPECERMLADLSADGIVDTFDIEPFLQRLFP